MAVTITKKFWNGTEFKNIAKIVFTSPNFTSPAVAGVRSHMPPGGDYMGTWYEAVDFMYRQQPNQDYADLPNEMESFFGKFTLLEDFDFANDTSASFQHSYGEGFDIDGPGTYNNILYKDKDNYGIISSSAATYSGAGGVITTDIEFSSVVGSGTLSIDENMFHQYSDVAVDVDTVIPRPRKSHGGNSIIFSVTFGEAYDCRLTAWDDDTHSTTTNMILVGEHYKVDATAYRSNVSTGIEHEPIFRNENCLVFPPVYNFVLKGNEKYYGDFDLIFSIDTDEYGEYLVFSTRLVDIDETFTAGSYDFVTTLHYQYT